MASEYLKWKYRDVKREERVEPTSAEQRKNWWHYHKWHVGLCAAAACIAASLIWNAATQVQPDYQIAYTASAPLSEEEEAAWESRLAALGSDCNGDGKVVVQLNQYLTAQGSADVMYAYASNIKLMADLDSCESYFFLLEDPEGFQASYEILQEDWVPLDNGLFLARRDFWGSRTPEHLEDYEQLWNALIKEEGP